MDTNKTLNSIKNYDAICYGCELCVHLCPKGAITLKENKMGFSYPVINEKSCINCGVCLSNCPNYVEDHKLHSVKNVYFGYSKSIESRLLSSSGAIFPELATAVIDEGGCCYGATTHNNIVEHILVTDKRGIDLLRGSKYVQSKLDIVYKTIEERLEFGPVLFSGTPCQVFAIRKYIEKKKLVKNRVIFVDIVCHGTPSPKMFSDYINLCEKKKKSSIVKHEFRSKKLGWHEHLEGNIFDNGCEDYKSYYSKLWKKMFYSHLTLRESCHNCLFASTLRCSDITIGDFRGIENVHLEYDDNQGISIIMLNSDTGSHYFDLIKNNLIYYSCSIDKVIQPNMRKPSYRPDLKDSFVKDYSEKGFGFVARKYFGLSVKNRIKECLFEIKKKI